MKNAAVKISAIGSAKTVANKTTQTTGMIITATKPIPNEIHGLSFKIVTVERWNSGRKRSERRPKINVETKLTASRKAHPANNAGHSRGFWGGALLEIFP